MTNASTESLAAAFARLAHALENQDVAAYRALAATDVAPQDGLFQDNAQRLRHPKCTLRLRQAVMEGDVAEVTFDVVDAASNRVDTGRVTFTLEPDGWRLRQL